MEHLESLDMYSLFFGQDEPFSLSQGQQKNIDNVLVEKFIDYGVDAAAEVDPNFEDVDALFDNEWMTSKIDLACLPEQLDNNFNLVSGDNEIDSNAATSLGSVGAEIQPPSVVTALLAEKTININQLDEADAGIICIEEPASEGANPPSPEQHVPDVDLGSEEQLKNILDSILAANRATPQLYTHLEDPNVNEVFVAEPAPGTRIPLKRKLLSDPVAESPKAKVRTPEQKQRKRLQNKNAATRYRTKKRSELEDLNAKCFELEGENQKLREKVENKQQEIQYLKNLIIDVFSKKHAGQCKN